MSLKQKEYWDYNKLGSILDKLQGRSGTMKHNNVKKIANTRGVATGSLGLPDRTL